MEIFGTTYANVSCIIKSRMCLKTKFQLLCSKQCFPIKTLVLFQGHRKKESTRKHIARNKWKKILYFKLLFERKIHRIGSFLVLSYLLHKSQEKFLFYCDLLEASSHPIFCFISSLSSLYLYKCIYLTVLQDTCIKRRKQRKKEKMLHILRRSLSDATHNLFLHVFSI